MSKPDIVISAHLLEGHSADESSPYVQGDYATHEKLRRLVKFRCVKILKSVVSESQVPDAGNIIIEARHGVRVSSSYGTTDEARTIYAVKIPIVQMLDPKWSELDDEQVMQRWKVENDVIPSLQFRSSF